MNVFAFSGLLLGSTCLFLGAVIFIYGKNKVHYTFALQNIAISVWGFAGAFAGLSKSPEGAYFWWSVAHAGGFFVATFLVHHALLMNKLSRKSLLAVLYFVSVLLPILFFTKRIGLTMEYIFNSFYFPKPANMVYPVFGLGWLLTAAYATFLILKRYKRASEEEIQSLKLYAFAYIMGLWGGAAYFLPVYGVKIYPYGNFLIPVYCSIVTYCILRHQLMNIEVVVKKTIVFAGLFTAIYGVFMGFAFLGQVVFERITGGNRLISLIPSIAIIVLILRPLENFLIRITDKFLFQKRYDYKELLKTFSTEVLTLLNIDKLVHTTVDRLSGIMKIESCGVLLLNDGRDAYELVASIGVEAQWKHATLKLDNTLASFLSRTESYLSTARKGMDSPLPKRILDDMNKLKLEFAIPLVIHHDMIGILTLGKKKSDEEYTQDDIDILIPLARTLAIAISNARVLDELGKTQAEAAQREKMAVIGTLSAGINHEICNPLGIARGQCEAFLLNLRDGLYKDKSDKELLEKAEQIMEKVIHETDRATIITKRLSSFAKPSKNLFTDDINLHESVNEVLALVGYEMRLDNVNIENTVPQDLPRITADRKQIQEVLFNLIRNSAQALEGRDRGTIVISGSRIGNTVSVQIEDTGHGIPDDKMSQIFNPFYTTKDPGKGTGLGLFIVRQVVERNKGRIFVRSKEGVGTIFTLEFPVSQEAGVP